MCGSTDLVSSVNLKNIVLKSSYASRLLGLKFAHINFGSIVAQNLLKFCEFKTVIDGVGLDLIGISESWLSEKHSDLLIDIPNYSVFRSDRDLVNKKRGGGVVIYLNKNLVQFSKIIHKSEIGSTIDYLFIEISNGLKESIVFGVIYAPPLITLPQSFLVLLNSLASRHSNFHLIGDFNRDHIMINKQTREFISFYSSLNLSNTSSYPTHFVGNSSSCIDLLLSNNSKDIVFYSQLNLPGISNHDLIYGLINFKISTSNDAEYKLFRNIKKINKEKLCFEAAGIMWSNIFTMIDPNDQLSFFNKNVMLLLNKFAPEKQIKIFEKKAEFLDKKLFHLMNIRDFHHNAWRRNKNNANWERYRFARNDLNCKKEMFKKKVLLDRFNPSLPSKILFRNLKADGILGSKQKPFPASPNDFNSYFGSVFVEPSSTTEIRLPEKATNDNLFYFANTTQLEIFEVIQSIKSNAVGADEIPLSFLKLFLPITIPYITHIINTIFTSSIFPDLWKIAKVIPIPKVSFPKSLSDFRPISVLPALSKVMEKLMKHQMNMYLNRNNYICQFQSGFRDNHSTVSALIKICDDLSLNVEEGKVSFLILLDYSKAFDKVPHIPLLNRFQTTYNFSEIATRLLESYLEQRSQQVFYEGSISDSIIVKSGVPQGSVVSPLFFRSYIDPIHEILTDIDFHLFADDLQIYTAAHYADIKNCIVKINSVLTSVCNWSLDNGLIINPLKSQAICISRKKNFDTYSLDPIMLDNIVIPFVDNVKNLGLTINKDLTWSNHIAKTKASAYAVLSRLWSVGNLLPVETKRKLVVSLIVPKLTYCSMIFAGCAKKDLGMLKSTINSCARYIYRKKRRDHISHFSRKILNCNFEDYLNFTACVYLQKLIISSRPHYLYSKINFSLSERTRKINNPKKMKSKQRRSTFFVHGVHQWNSLNPRLRASGSLNAFKKLCFKFFAETEVIAERQKD